MSPSKSRAVIAVVLFCATLTLVGFAQESPSAIVEQGKFTLHKFEQPLGEETYVIRREGDSLAATIDFKFTDRGTEVPLSTTFRAGQDLTPLSFEIKGRTARTVSIDQAITIDSRQVHFRTRDQSQSSAAPTGPFFTIAGYAPATMQMLMVRYWASHGSPAQLPTLPKGSVEIEPRGQDAVAVGNQVEKLDRFTIEGLIWGRETLWFDSEHKLVAAITTDAEFDHFEAIRHGYESALPDFVGRAGRDEMSALAELSKTIPGSHSPTLAIVGAILLPVGYGAISDAQSHCTLQGDAYHCADGSYASQGTAGRAEASAGWALLSVGVVAVGGGMVWQLLFNKPSTTTGAPPAAPGKMGGLPAGLWMSPTGGPTGAGVSMGGSF